jgi:hypothetical protein
VLLRFVLWNLADSKTTLEELRRYLRDEPVDQFKEVYLWESAEAGRQELPSRARRLIGKEPDIGEEFDVEETIEGAFAVEELSRRGLAFEA